MSSPNICLFCTATIILTISNAIVTQATVQGSQKNFTKLGVLELHDGTSSTRGISYFVSEYELTHSQALLECREVFFGRLLTIYTKEQDEYIRLRLQDLNLDRIYVHTAGRYNADVQNKHWEWATTTTPTYYDNWRIGQPSQEAAGYCIELLGASSVYGWVSMVCTNPHLFICEILI